MKSPTHIRRPTVLQVLPELNSGGVERGTIEIARALAQAGWRPIVASAGGKLVAQLRQSGAEHVELPLASKNPLVMWRNAGKLAALIRRERVAIVHARSRAPAWSAWHAVKNTNAHFMTTFHGVYSAHTEWKKRYNSIMTRGERVIAISEFIARHITENYEMDAARLRMIPRGVDLRLFHPGSHSPQRMIELMQSWGLPEHLPVILFPGRLTRWKGQDVFLRALAALPHRQFFAVILGEAGKHDGYRQELEQLIAELKLEGHARIVPSTSHMTEAYSLARLVVATSVGPEAFGRVPIESQAMGKPVIATAHGGACETVIHGETGWLVEPGNVGALADAIAQALGLDEDAQSWMNEQALANARRFSIQMMCDATLGVYQELL